ncbi:hypothetical protein AB1Y20_010888 [Prymnesium parvum]|uniref:Uncharacterized protein n=1 Tax=Prymnesium parvum TaxID=97485 RepID=A0AB34ISM4_PRYPA
MFCSCVPCTLLDFEHCEMTAMMGRTQQVLVPLPRGTASRVPQIESLQEWADQLKPNMVVAVRANGAEWQSEGPVWLLHIDSEAFEVPEDMVHATAEYEAGWLVVRGRWYQLEQRSPRGYKLDTAERLVVANTMIRLQIALFAGGVWGKAPRAPRSGLHVMPEDSSQLDLSDSDSTNAAPPKPPPLKSARTATRTKFASADLPADDDDDSHRLLQSVLQQLASHHAQTDSGKMSARVQQKLDGLLDKARKTMHSNLAASRDEFERAKKAAEAKIASEAAKLDAAAREFEAEAAALSKAVGEFIQRNAHSRAAVQREAASAKEACARALQRHETSCAATVQKAIKKVRLIKQRRLPIDDLIRQVTGMSDSLEKELAQP